MSEPLHICVVAGEASGDFLGSRLMRSLKSGREVRFSGVGGPLMAAEGLQSLFPMNDLSVMGLAEVLPRIPKLARRIRQTADHIGKSRPDMVITIDSPDFSFRVTRKVREDASCKPVMVHYVAPTVWAWRPERAAKVADLYDGILCLFPFEPPYFEKEGIKAAFTGHPVLETLKGGDRAAFRQAQGISPDAPVLGVLFGSRIGELNRVGPVLREAAYRLAQEKPGLVLVSPTLPHLKREVRNFMREMPCEFVTTTDPAQKKDAFAAMDTAIATSGTVGLELAVAGVPHVIAYKMNPLTWQIVRRKVTVRHAHLGNILLEDTVIPEFIQKDCTPEKIRESAKELLDSEERRQGQKSAFVRIRGLLAGQNKNGPSEQAASFILDRLESPTRREPRG